jgi:hypothetical protein
MSEFSAAQEVTCPVAGLSGMLEFQAQTVNAAENAV